MTSDTDITYAYDAENRLVSISGVGENAAFSYDPLGRLLKTTINGNTRWYLNSGDNLLAEYVGGAVTERYVHAANMGTPVAMYAGATMSESSLAYLHTNHQGSVIAYSNATGSIYQVNSYDEYGMTAESNLGRFGYTGQLYFGDLGLYHYRARFYSPGLGRFLQTDPVGYEDQMNLYAYVGNDPMNNSDPLGLYTCANDDCSQATIDPYVGQEGSPPFDSSIEGSGEYKAPASITFENDDPSGTSPNQPVTTETAQMVENAVAESGATSVNINSSTGGTHSTTSRHYQGRAVDINRVNGERVDSASNEGAVEGLQDSFANQSNIRENFGPSRTEKTVSPGGRVVQKPSLKNSHRNHIHVSGQY